MARSPGHQPPLKVNPLSLKANSFLLPVGDGKHSFRHFFMHSSPSVSCLPVLELQAGPRHCGSSFPRGHMEMAQHFSCWHHFQPSSASAVQTHLCMFPWCSLAMWGCGSEISSFAAALGSSRTHSMVCQWEPPMFHTNTWCDMPPCKLLFSPNPPHFFHLLLIFSMAFCSALVYQA